MDYKTFEMVDGSAASLPVQRVVGGIVPFGLSNRMPVRVRLPFEEVSDKYGYPSLYFRKTQRRLNRDWYDFEAAVNSYLIVLDTVLATFKTLFSSYDAEVVLPTTSALSYVPTAHFDLDEKGVFGHNRKFRFPDEILNYIVAKRRKQLSMQRKDDLHLSLKRGTNLGWPTQKSNSGRLERDILLAAHVALSIGASQKGFALKDVTQFLSTYHGHAYAVAGERLQHTDRVLPVFTRGFKGFIWHGQPRVRGIYFSPKYCVAWNRINVKKYLHVMMHDPIHTQDRHELAEWFSQFATPSYYAFSIDVSRFDQSVGGDAGRQILRVLAASLAGDDAISAPSSEAVRIFDDFDHEFSMPCLIRTSSGLYMSKGAEILSSGLSTTSLIGSTYSEALVYLLAASLLGSLQRAIENFGSQWSALTWGDDIVFAFKKEVLPCIWPSSSELVESVDDVLKQFSQDVDLEFTQEPTLKFLGQNYDMLSYSDASTAYPLGRFVQQQFFPERLKTGPAQQIGFIARNALLHADVQKEVFDRTMKISELARVDVPFTWRDRASVLQKAVQDISLSSRDVMGVDDVLNLFTHGLEADDLEGAEVLPEGLDVMEELLAQSTVNLDDPRAFLSEVADLHDTRILRLVSSLARGELTSWYSICQELQRRFGGSLIRNDSYY